MNAPILTLVPRRAATVERQPEWWRVRITQVVVAESPGPCEHCADEFEDTYVAAAWVSVHWDPIESRCGLVRVCWEHHKAAVENALDDSPEDSTIRVDALVLGSPRDPSAQPEPVAA